MDNNKNQGYGLDKRKCIDYILNTTGEKCRKNEHDLYIISTALNEKKNVRVEIETTFGNISTVVVWIKEKRGLYRKLSL